MSEVRLILFDRDGTLTYENENYHRDLTEVKSYPFTASALNGLRDGGYQLAVVTNQSGIGRGYWSEDEVTALHARLMAEWGLDMQWYICPHLPDAGCDCRKPNAGMITEALADHDISAKETIMVGDSAKDAAAAAAAGVEFALVLTGRGRDTLSTMKSRPAAIASIAEIETLLA